MSMMDAWSGTLKNDTKSVLTKRPHVTSWVSWETVPAGRQNFLVKAKAYTEPV